MPLHLVTGPANSGKAGRLLREHRARLDEDAVLVVPTRGDVERAELELASAGAVFGARVLSFDGLVTRLAERLGVAGAPVATPLQRELLMAAALRAAPLGPASSRRGLRRSALRVVTELERAGVEPAAFSDGLARWAAAGRVAHDPPHGPGARDPRLPPAPATPADQRLAPAPHVLDLGALYAAYRSRLDAAGLVDREVLARRTVDALRAAPSRLEPAPVFVHGFDDFTELELDLLEALAGPVGAAVTVSLPFEPGREAFRAVAPVAARLLGMAASHEHLEPSAAHYAAASRAALHHLERRLFEPSVEPVDPGNAVLLLEPGGERAEVELVGARVRGLLDAGTPAGDVAVVFRDPAAVTPLVERVFEAYGIPWAAGPPAELGHTALGRGLLALLRASGEDGGAGDVLAHLRAPGSLRRPELADRLEARLRRDGTGAAHDAAARWEELAWPLDDRRALAEARGSLPELLTALGRALERAWAAPRRREAPVLGAEELEDARAYAAARAALDDIAALGEDAGLDRHGVHDLLATLRVDSEGRPALDAVQLASPEGVRARRFGAVFVCGLREGEFPRAGAPEPLLPDDERRALAATSGVRLPMRADDLERERYLFYVCASRAEGLLALSVPTCDEEGAPLAPSPLLDEVGPLFAPTLAERSVVRSLAEVTWDEHEAPSRLERERALAAAAPRPRADPPAALAHPEVLEHLAARPAFSAGALEVYGDCPVRWLVERVLRADALEPDPEALVRGSFAHDVLERTYRRLAERTGSARVTPDSLPEAERLLAEALEERAPAHRISPSASRAAPALHRLEADLVRHLRREAATPGPFEPAELELSFGMEEDDDAHPALDLGDEVRIRGRIDRVDTWGTKAVVRDYKTGRRAHPGASWEGDGRLQAPLYLLAVRQILGLEPAGALYVPLAGDDKPRGAWLDELEDELGPGLVAGDRTSRERLDEHLETARRTARELAGRVRAGDVRPTPATCHPRGGGCAYPSICREEG